MTNDELRTRFHRLEIEMRYLAAQMAGRGPEFEQHMHELNGAARIVRNWVADMPGDEQKKPSVEG